jgi:ribonuclease HII
MIKYIVGVDEAGRGPLAGPVSIGVAVVPHDFDWDLIPGVGDSKKVSEKNREAIFLLTKRLKKANLLDYVVILVSAKIIDTKGISFAIQSGIAKAFAKLDLNPKHVSIKLDGLLKAPEAFVHQETIVKGDAKEKVIGLASIMAKVTRDMYMTRLAKKYPEYDFAIHKGYGTEKHRKKIKQYGISKEHRKSFIH